MSRVIFGGGAEKDGALYVKYHTTRLASRILNGTIVEHGLGMKARLGLEPLFHMQLKRDGLRFQL